MYHVLWLWGFKIATLNLELFWDIIMKILKVIKIVFVLYL